MSEQRCLGRILRYRHYPTIIGARRKAPRAANSGAFDRICRPSVATGDNQRIFTGGRVSHHEDT